MVGAGEGENAFQRAAKWVLPDMLCPVIVDIESSGHRFVDSFLWSLREEEMSAEAFARLTCAEEDLPNNFVQLIALAIREQVSQAWTLLRHVTERVDSGRSALCAPAPTLRVDVNYKEHRFQEELRWDVPASPEAVARNKCAHIDKRFEAAVAFALRRELLRSALGYVQPNARQTTPNSYPRPEAIALWYKTKSEAIPPEPMKKIIHHTTSTSQPSLDHSQSSSRPPPFKSSTHPQPTKTKSATARSTPAAADSTKNSYSYFPIDSMRPKTQSQARATLQQQAQGTTHLSPSTTTEKPTETINKPKFINAYIMFSTSYRSTLVQKHPNANTVDIARILGDCWNKMGERERQTYENLARQENAKRQADFASKNAAAAAAAAAAAPAPAPAHANANIIQTNAPKPTQPAPPITAHQVPNPALPASAHPLVPPQRPPTQPVAMETDKPLSQSLKAPAPAPAVALPQAHQIEPPAKRLATEKLGAPHAVPLTDTMISSLSTATTRDAQPSTTNIKVAGAPPCIPPSLPPPPPPPTVSTGAHNTTILPPPPHHPSYVSTKSSAPAADNTTVPVALPPRPPSSSAAAPAAETPADPPVIPNPPPPTGPTKSTEREQGAGPSHEV